MPLPEPLGIRSKIAERLRGTEAPTPATPETPYPETPAPIQQITYVTEGEGISEAIVDAKIKPIRDRLDVIEQNNGIWPAKDTGMKQSDAVMQLAGELIKGTDFPTRLDEHDGKIAAIGKRADDVEALIGDPSEFTSAYLSPDISKASLVSKQIIVGYDMSGQGTGQGQAAAGPGGEGQHSAQPTQPVPITITQTVRQYNRSTKDMITGKPDMSNALGFMAGRMDDMAQNVGALESKVPTTSEWEGVKANYASLLTQYAPLKGRMDAVDGPTGRIGKLETNFTDPNFDAKVKASIDRNPGVVTSRIPAASKLDLKGTDLTPIFNDGRFKDKVFEYGDLRYPKLGDMFTSNMKHSFPTDATLFNASGKTLSLSDLLSNLTREQFDLKKNLSERVGTIRGLIGTSSGLDAGGANLRGTMFGLTGTNKETITVTAYGTSDWGAEDTLAFHFKGLRGFLGGMRSVLSCIKLQAGLYKSDSKTSIDEEMGGESLGYYVHQTGSTPGVGYFQDAHARWGKITDSVMGLLASGLKQLMGDAFNSLGEGLDNLPKDKFSNKMGLTNLDGAVTNRNSADLQLAKMSGAPIPGGISSLSLRSYESDYGLGLGTMKQGNPVIGGPKQGSSSKYRRRM